MRHVLTSGALLLALAVPAHSQVSQDPLDHPVTDSPMSSGEAHVVADPGRAATAVTAFLDFRGNPMVAIRRTTDGGRQWRETATFLPPNGDLWTADPSLAFAADGTLYVGYLQGVTREGTQRGGGLFVARSTDGGVTWEAPVVAVPSLDQGVCSGPDKSMIAAGPGRAVHISYQDHTDGPEPGCDGDGPTIVRIASSYDGGRTFEAPVALTAPEDNAFGSMPRVLPDGTLLVSHLGFPEGGLEQFVERSFDRGRSFRRVRVAESVAPAAVAGGAPLAANAIPTLSTDADGRVAMAWVAGEGPSEEDNLIEVRVSGNGGESWQALPPVATGLPIALQQWLAHGPDGRLHLFFYGVAPGGLYDAFLATFDGREWSLPARLSSVSSSGAIGYGFGIGHYPGLDVGRDGIAYPLWSDARARPAAYSFHLWTRSVMVGGARPFAAASPAPAPAAQPPAAPAGASAPRVRVRRIRRGFAVTVDAGATVRSLRLELVRRGRVVARARRPLGKGARTIRLRARPGARYLLRVAAIDARGGRVVVTRHLRR